MVVCVLPYKVYDKYFDVAHDVDASFGHVKMTLKSVRYFTTSIAVLRYCREFAIRKVACSNPEFYLRYQAQCSHIMYSNFELLMWKTGS